MNNQIKLTLLLGILVTSFSYSQSDSIRKNDSINSKILKEYRLQQVSNSKELRLDSIKKSQLEQELLSLKTTDNLKKSELLNQLEELKNSEKNRIAAKKAQIEAMKGSAKGYPVIGAFSDTLFLIYERLGSFSAKDRADAITNRLAVLEGDYNFDSKSLKISTAETTIDIVSGKKSY